MQFLPIMVGTPKSFQSERGTRKFSCSNHVCCRDWVRAHDWVELPYAVNFGVLMDVAMSFWGSMESKNMTWLPLLGVYPPPHPSSLSISIEALHLATYVES